MRIGSIYTGRVLVEDLIDSPDADVPPGETYQTTCRPRERAFVNEILIRDFAIAELYVGNRFVQTKEHATIVGSRAYHIGIAGAEVPIAQEVRIVLKNETDHALRARQATFEEERR